MITDIEFIPYGEICSELKKGRWRKRSRHVRVSQFRESKTQAPHRIFITFSYDLDESFVEMFRKKATQKSRLLVLNEGISTDRLLSKILDLQIRTPGRCCILEGKFGSGKTHAFLQTCLKRFLTTLESKGEFDRIFDARIE